MKLLDWEAERLCSRIYKIHPGHEQCGKNLTVFRMGVLQLKSELYIVHNHILGHVIIFPEDIGEEENIITMGVVD